MNLFSAHLILELVISGMQRGPIAFPEYWIECHNMTCFWGNHQKHFLNKLCFSDRSICFYPVAALELDFS